MPFRITLTSLLTLLACATLAIAQPIPGDGLRIDAISDDFEDPAWSFNHDTATSANGLWRGSFRGAPDVVEPIASPAGGLSGQSQSLLLRSQDFGKDATPGQDDFVSQSYTNRGVTAPTRADLPSVIARVYLPEVEELNTEWGVFGMRLEAVSNDRVGGADALGRYYPSIWINYWPQGESNHPTRSQPYLSFRLGDGYAIDVAGPYLAGGGWYTFGLAFDEAGIAHYYASGGVDPLTEADRVFNSTQFATNHTSGVNPGMDSVNYHFFSMGYPETHDWSMAFLIDDVSVYMIPEPGSALLVLGTLAGMMMRRRRAR
ncbi:PEP-CTERM sorting domain-containing protein [Phycisphaerales bacterium AB-hyl4]|uniref:PEP-CTERM sorting domain-containing protein n=1 Tax=Natronomicrosphaera hydrolytica TaxID=3242702 RepID=A0ABV4U8L8_9BACT